jgi:hypothetical protein
MNTETKAASGNVSRDMYHAAVESYFLDGDDERKFLFRTESMIAHEKIRELSA